MLEYLLQLKNSIIGEPPGYSWFDAAPYLVPTCIGGWLLFLVGSYLHEYHQWLTKSVKGNFKSNVLDNSDHLVGGGFLAAVCGVTLSLPAAWPFFVGFVVVIVPHLVLLSMIGYIVFIALKGLKKLILQKYLATALLSENSCVREHAKEQAVSSKKKA